MSNIKDILTQNDDLVQSNGALSHTNLKLQVEAAVYADAMQLAIISLRAGRCPTQVADELEAALSPRNQKRTKKVEPAA